MKKIVVIEDQPQMRRNICLILTMEGYEIQSAADGGSGLDLIQQHHPDLVICDVRMPGIGGHEVLQRLRADPATATLPFVFLTANGEREDIRGGMNLGADDYLTKPVTREDLLATVSSRLTRKTAHRAEIAAARPGFHPDFTSPEPLLALGLTAREAEVLLWVSQGKGNADVASLLGMSEKTAKKHMGNIFDKLGVENRNAASMMALERLSGSPPAPQG